MSIRSVGPSIQSPYSQKSTSATNALTDVTASAATSSFTTMLQPFDPGRALTADDMALIGYPNPSNPYVTMMASSISEFREKGLIQGKITGPYYRLDDGTQGSIFDVMPIDAQSMLEFAPLKDRMLAKFAEHNQAASSIVVKGANPARALTLEDMVLIGYPDPNDSNVATLAEGISQAREAGQLSGPITEAFLKGGTVQYKTGLFDLLPHDPASLKSSVKTMKAVLNRLHGVQDTKETDLTNMLRKAGFLKTTSVDAVSAARQLQPPKLKAMLRDYGG